MKKIDRYEILNDGLLYDNDEKEYLISPSLLRKQQNRIICDLLNKLDKRIKELEKENKELEIKLEESEKERDDNYENYSICWKDNEYLKQQLAEKDKQLLCKSWYKQYKNVMEVNEGFYNECAKLREQLAEKEKENQRLRLSQNLIAIDILQSVLCKVENIFNNAIKNCSCNSSYYDKVMDVIDNQIEKLKVDIDDIKTKELKAENKKLKENIKQKLILHCDYSYKLGWYITEDKIKLIIDKIK